MFWSGLAPLVKVAEPQARLGQHSGIGCELVLTLEQPVDASALAFIKEQEEKGVGVGFREKLEVAERTSPLPPPCDFSWKKKKRKKRRLPRSSRPRLVSGCCRRSTRARPRLLRNAWFCSGYMFLPRSRRLFGTNSTLFLREGGPWLLRSILAATCRHGCLQAQDACHLGWVWSRRTFMPRHRDRFRCSRCSHLGNLVFLRATGIWHPLVRCLSRRRSTRKIWSFLGDDYAEIYDPLFLTVTCSVFACGVQD